MSWDEGRCSEQGGRKASLVGGGVLLNNLRGMAGGSLLR